MTSPQNTAILIYANISSEGDINTKSISGALLIISLAIYPAKLYPIIENTIKDNPE